MQTKTGTKRSAPVRNRGARKAAGAPVERRELPKASWRQMKKVYDILSRRYDGGDPRVAERHNEHQP